MSFTFATLKTAIQNYTENTETTFVDSLSTFIIQAEERILKNVQLSNFRKNATAAFTSSNQYLACPSDFLAPNSLTLSNSSVFEFLQFKDLEFVRSYNPNASTTGTPKYYAQFDVDNFLLAPTPDSGYTVNLNYFYRPSSITAGVDSGTTWLSENAELALLYGSLIECYIYMKGDGEVMNMYNNRFTESIVRLKELGEAREVTDEYKTGSLKKVRS